MFVLNQKMGLRCSNLIHNFNIVKEIIKVHILTGTSFIAIHPLSSNARDLYILWNLSNTSRFLSSLLPNKISIDGFDRVLIFFSKILDRDGVINRHLQCNENTVSWCFLCLIIEKVSKNTQSLYIEII